MKVADTTYKIGDVLKLKDGTIICVVEVRLFIKADSRTELYLYKMGDKYGSFDISQVYCKVKVNEIA